jgi:hypothetical protein
MWLGLGLGLGQALEKAPVLAPGPRLVTGLEPGRRNVRLKQ